VIQVWIVDGQTEVRWGMRLRLAIELDLAVVGKAGRASEALAMDKALGHDLIVVDRGMQGACAANVVLRLRAAAPGPISPALTLLGDADAHAQALEPGGQALPEKRGGAADMLQAIRQSPRHQLPVSKGRVTLVCQSKSFCISGFPQTRLGSESTSDPWPAGPRPRSVTLLQNTLRRQARIGQETGIC
jgi:DNA-binding NarL/FixJ family response regulator